MSMGSEQQDALIVGADIRTNMTSGYSVNLKKVFVEAARTTRTTNLALFQAIGILILMTVTFALTIYQTMNVMGTDLSRPESWLLGGFILAIFIAPLLTGMNMMAIRHAAGLRSSAKRIFAYYKDMNAISLITAMKLLLIYFVVTMMLLMGIHPVVTLIPALFIYTAFGFAATLAVEKRVSVPTALQVSFRLFTKRPVELVLLRLSMLGIIIIAMAPFGMGLLWLAPLVSNMKGVLYREICGIRLENVSFRR